MMHHWPSPVERCTRAGRCTRSTPVGAVPPRSTRAHTPAPRRGRRWHRPASDGPQVTALAVVLPVAIVAGKGGRLRLRVGPEPPPSLAFLRVHRQTTEAPGCVSGSHSEFGAPGASTVKDFPARCCGCRHSRCQFRGHPHHCRRCRGRHSHCRGRYLRCPEARTEVRDDGWRQVRLGPTGSGSGILPPGLAKGMLRAGGPAIVGSGARSRRGGWPGRRRLPKSGSAMATAAPGR